MRSKLPFYKKETSYSCVPACLRMVLASFGVDVSETRLRQLCDCTTFGTEALKAVDVARQLGFAQSAKYTLTIDELENLIAAGHYPIVFVNLLPVDAVEDAHALVVLALSKAAVTVYDPLYRERTLPRETFCAAWAMMHGLAIIIEK